MAEDGATAEPDSGQDQQEDTGQKKALLVDDSPLDQLKFEEMLERLGFKVTVAPNGHVAISMLDKVMPDLIVLDVIMPMKSGIQILDEIRAMAKFRNVPIVMLTSKDDVRMIRAALKKGPTDYLLKSLPPEEIEDRIKRYI